MFIYVKVVKIWHVLCLFLFDVKAKIRTFLFKSTITSYFLHYFAVWKGEKKCKKKVSKSSHKLRFNLEISLQSLSYWCKVVFVTCIFQIAPQNCERLYLYSNKHAFVQLAFLPGFAQKMKNILKALFWTLKMSN